MFTEPTVITATLLGDFTRDLSPDTKTHAVVWSVGAENAKLSPLFLTNVAYLAL